MLQRKKPPKLKLIPLRSGPAAARLVAAIGATCPPVQSKGDTGSLHVPPKHVKLNAQIISQDAVSSRRDQETRASFTMKPRLAGPVVSFSHHPKTHRIACALHFAFISTKHPPLFFLFEAQKRVGAEEAQILSLYQREAIISSKIALMLVDVSVAGRNHCSPSVQKKSFCLERKAQGTGWISTIFQHKTEALSCPVLHDGTEPGSWIPSG